jgi:hypothetical protein
MLWGVVVGKSANFCFLETKCISKLENYANAARKLILYPCDLTLFVCKMGICNSSGSEKGSMSSKVFAVSCDGWVELLELLRCRRHISKQVHYFIFFSFFIPRSFYIAFAICWPGWHVTIVLRIY